MPTIVTRPRRTVAEVTVVATYQPKIDVNSVFDEIGRRTAAGVNKVAYDSHQLALKLVPIRKIFRYGRNRNGLRFQAHQEVRTLSFDEAQGEEKLRKRLGLPSAFATSSDSGRRIRSAGPQVQTAQFPSGYQSRNKANDSRSLERREFANVRDENRLVTITQIPHEVSTGRGKKAVRFTPKVEINLESESDLSARGRYELRKGRAISKGDDFQTLGGALRKTVERGLTRAVPGGRYITATLQAGDEKVDYAKYVEFGTRRSKAQPFLRPALAQAREQLLRTVHDEIVGKGG